MELNREARIEEYQNLDGSIRRKYIVPVGNKSKKEAKKSIKKLMEQYKTEIKFPTEDYWFPVKKI